jgi:hypothetical protein
MNQRFLVILATAVLSTVAAFGQPLNSATPDSFQVRYAANLNIGDSVVNITNTGSSAGAGNAGNLCVQVYTSSPDEQLISCCTCTVTPDGLASLSVRNSLTSNTLTGVVPTAVVIKLVATVGVGACNAAVENTLAPGLLAWGTTLHALPVTAGTPATTYGVAETAFGQSGLSAVEYARLATLCAFIQTDGSGFGICKGCAAGGLGAAAAQ